ncbi:4635_t:CDS:1, partial [Scutellospora calospora]
MWNIIIQHHISTHTKQLNSKNNTNQSLKIRIQQIQDAVTSNESILTSKTTVIPIPEDNTTTAKQIMLLHKADFGLSNLLAQWPITQQRKGT